MPAPVRNAALLAAFAEDARARGAIVVSLDCGGIEPTERGFFAALDRAIRALRAEPPGGIRAMAASARGARPDLTVPDAAVATVVTELARVYLSGLDKPTRAVLDAACTLRRPTLSLLGALLPDIPPHDAYDMLRPLPFVEFGPDGLVLHDTVREVVAALLRVNDPPAYRAHRIAAWRQLRRELRTAPPADLWRYTADLLYLIENPAVREAFFPPPATGTQSSQRGRPMKPRSSPSPARTSQPGQSP